MKSLSCTAAICMPRLFLGALINLVLLLFLNTFSISSNKVFL